jgi:hypothetical protein
MQSSFPYQIDWINKLAIANNPYLTGVDKDNAVQAAAEAELVFYNSFHYIDDSLTEMRVILGIFMLYI